MRYTWDGACAFEMAAIPKAAADQLKLANPFHLRVLIWLCCVGQGTFDAAACAKACGVSPEVCLEAMEYWSGRGLIRYEASETPAAPVAQPVVVQSAVAQPVVAQPALTVEPVAPPSAPNYPSRTEVYEAIENDKAYAAFLQTAEQKLGRWLSEADKRVFLYLYQELKLPPEVILMVIGYAVKNGKAKLTYIEKTAIGWVEDGITTIAAADEFLCRIERRESAWAQLSEWCEHLGPRPTLKQKETAARWIAEWGFTKELLEPVIAYTVETLGTFQMPYCDRILERLHAEGVKTPEQVKENLTKATVTAAPKKRSSRMKTASDRAPSYDLDQYEEMAMRHRPRLPVKEG
ncbi:MAG: DnaD domain protein [Clostridia bacterium]|nr:DnaD domain protein [Clostridia bacterium]